MPSERLSGVQLLPPEMETLCHPCLALKALLPHVFPVTEPMEILHFKKSVPAPLTSTFPPPPTPNLANLSYQVPTFLTSLGRDVYPSPPQAPSGHRRLWVRTRWGHPSGGSRREGKGRQRGSGLVVTVRARHLTSRSLG